MTNKYRDIIAYRLTLGILCITGLSLGCSFFGWPIFLELLSHFKVQYFLGVLVLCCWLVFRKPKKLLFVGLFCLAILAADIIPWYLPQAATAGTAPANFRIFLSNVNLDNPNYDKVISLVKQEQPDLAVFQEITQTWVQQLEPLKEIFPYSMVQPKKLYNLGIAVFSKQPLEAPTLEFLASREQATILKDITINGQVISILATKTKPPHKPDLFQWRNQQLEATSQYVKSVQTPVVVIGDLNITMWSPYYRQTIGQTHLKNARQGFGILPSWPTARAYSGKLPPFLPLLFSVPIDHCLVSPDIQVVNIRTGPDVGSDHRPLIVDLAIKRITTETQSW